MWLDDDHGGEAVVGRRNANGPVATLLSQISCYYLLFWCWERLANNNTSLSKNQGQISPTMLGGGIAEAA
jgi:hypothetical protein